MIDHLTHAAEPDVLRIHREIALLIVIYLIWNVIAYFRSYLADRADQMLIFDLRRELFGHLQRMSLGFYEKRKIGSIASRLLSDIALAQNFVGSVFTNTLMDLSSLLIISALLFWMNWRLALVSIGILPIYVGFNKYFKKHIRATSRLAQEKMEEIAGDVQEKLSGISIIQSYTREKVEERHFLVESRTYLRYRISNIKNNSFASSIVGFLTSIAPVIVVWYGALQVIDWGDPMPPNKMYTPGPRINPRPHRFTAFMACSG